MTKKSTITIILTSLLLLGLIFRLWASQLAWMHYDENYYINIARGFFTQGILTPYMWRLGGVNIISGGGSGYGIILLNYLFRAMNYSLVGGRIVMVIFNLLSAGIMYYVSRRWWSSDIAGLAAFGFAIVSTSSFNTLILKMDSIAILTYSLSLLLYVESFNRQHLWLHFLVGFTFVVTLEFHVLGAVYVFMIGLCYLYEIILDSIHQHKLTLNPKCLGFIAGVSIAGAIYFAIHVLPDPRNYFVISRSCFECNESLFTTEFKRLIRLFVFRPHEVLIILGLFIFVIKNDKNANRRYLVLLSGWLIGEAIINVPPYDHYFNHFWPIIAIGIGGVVDFSYKSRFQKWVVPVSVISAFALLFTNMGMYLSDNYFSLLSYPLKISPEVQYILKNIKQNEVVMGNVPNYYFLQDYPEYLSYRDGSIYGTILRNENMLSFWQRTQPSVIILDHQIVNNDNELQQYIKEGNFNHLMPNLWVRDR